MDQSNFKLPKPSLSSIVIAVAAGVVVAVGVYQAQIRGLIPNKGIALPKPLEETRTIFKEENAVISVVEKTSPSVVAIGVTSGTGFVVSDEGIIATNKHVVVDPGTKYSVITKDDQKYEVKRIYRDPIFDLALVQIDASGLKALELGDSSKLKVGQTVIAIGNVTTTGVVSGLGRKAVGGDNLIQTDAVINLGNTGGPLLNSSGQVIGVNAVLSEGAQNIGFAIPINSVKAIVDEFVSQGSVSRPFLGVQYSFVPQGAYIQSVVDSSPAQKSGIEQGDIITKINGQNADNESKIAESIQNSAIGKKLELEIRRDNKLLKIEVTLSELPAE